MKIIPAKIPGCFELFPELHKDLRGSFIKTFHAPTFKEFGLKSKQGNMIYIPSGFAHGFCTLNKTSTLVYNTSTIYNPNKDNGIRWDTANISWPIENPKISDRDLQLQDLKNFISPFVFDGKII